MKICELKQKEVINICTCRSLGCPIDAEFDCKSSQLTALILPGPGRFCCLFGRDNEYIIPWECISQIGDDIILVKIDEDCYMRIILTEVYDNYSAATVLFLFPEMISEDPGSYLRIVGLHPEIIRRIQ